MRLGERRGALSIEGTWFGGVAAYVFVGVADLGGVEGAGVGVETDVADVELAKIGGDGVDGGVGKLGSRSAADGAGGADARRRWENL